MTELQEELIEKILRITEENQLIAVDAFVGKLLDVNAVRSQPAKKPPLQSHPLKAGDQGYR